MSRSIPRPASPAAAVLPLQLDRPFLGVLLMLGFCALAPLGDATAKFLGDTVPLGQILAARFAVQAVVFAPLVLVTGGSLWMSPRVLFLTALRTALQVAALGTMYLSLRFLPLADAVAIAFVMPFVLLLLGRLVLGEEVGPRRLTACAIGFCGTLLVVQPSFATVGAPALLPLGVAVLFALFMLTTRAVARETEPMTLQAVGGAMASLVLLPLMAMAEGSGWRELDPVTPDAVTCGLILMLGLVGTVSHLLLAWSLRFAPAATLAPMQYLEIPFATLVGFIVFAELPNALAAAGIAITTASGLYVMYRERRRARPLPTGADL